MPIHHLRFTIYELGGGDIADLRLLLHPGWMSGKRSENLSLPRSRDGNESPKLRPLSWVIP